MSNNVVYMDRNENNYGPAPACFEVLKKADLTKLSWYDRSFTTGSKGILSARLAHDFGLAEDRIILGYGAEHLLKQTIQCYLQKNQKLMIPAYSWWYYKKIAAEVGGISIEYPMIKGEKSFLYDVPGMKEMYRRERPAIVFISSPNNPTGNALGLTDLKDVLTEFKDAVVVMDEAYAYHGKIDYINDLVESHPRLMVARTFSKYYALAGMRIGFAVVGKEMAELGKFANRYLGYHRLSEEIAIAALDATTYYQGIARAMWEDKEEYYEKIGRIPGCTVFRSEANFILVEIPAKHKEGLQAALKQKGLIVKFMEEPLLNSHIRITIGTREQNKMVINAITSYFT